MRELITIDILSKAIQNEVGMGKDDADFYALHILNFFGYSDRILDNVLEQEDRTVFRQFEDHGLLDVDQEEILLYDGREWRIHYFTLKEDKIHRAATEKPKENIVDEEEDVYLALPDEVWEKHANPKKKVIV